MTDISPESVKAFVEKWDAPARHTDVRMTDSPPTPFGEAMLMLTALSAERDRLMRAWEAKHKSEVRARKHEEELHNANQHIIAERDALKAKLARLVEAAEEIDKWRMQSLEMMPPEIRGSWMRLHQAIAAAREPLP